MDLCVLCHVERHPDTPDALAWAHEPPDRWLCPHCVRRHVRDVEAKLAAEWWTPDA